MTERCKRNTHIKSKGQCKDKISVSKRIHIFPCTTMTAKQPYIDIYIVRTLVLCLPSDQ